jgi:hypothetical protein
MLQLFKVAGVNGLVERVNRTIREVIRTAEIECKNWGTTFHSNTVDCFNSKAFASVQHQPLPLTSDA